MSISHIIFVVLLVVGAESFQKIKSGADRRMLQLVWTLKFLFLEFERAFKYLLSSQFLFETFANANGLPVHKCGGL